MGAAVEEKGEPRNLGQGPGEPDVFSPLLPGPGLEPAPVCCLTVHFSVCADGHFTQYTHVL